METRTTYDPRCGLPIGYLGPELVENSSKDTRRSVEVSDEIFDKFGIHEMPKKELKKARELLELIGIKIDEGKSEQK